MRTAAALVLVFAALVGGMVWFSGGPAVIAVDELDGMGVFVMPEPRAIDDFELVDHTGAPFTAADFEGSWSFVFFGYASCPDICPITMSILGQAERLLGDEATAFKVVLVTVDPARDSPEVLADYVASFSPRFQGVTGIESDIAAFARQMSVGFRKEESDSQLEYLVGHSPYIIIVDPNGEYFGYAKPPFDAKKLALTFRSLAASR